MCGLARWGGTWGRAKPKGGEIWDRAIPRGAGAMAMLRWGEAEVGL